MIFQQLRLFLTNFLINKITNGIVVILLGLLIALGPHFLFKVCAHGEESFPRCHWSAQAETGMGALIAMLGLAVIMFGEPKTRQGLNIGVFFAAIMVLCIPHALIGGCGMMSMACRKTAFPAITLIGAVLLLYSMLGAIYLERPQEKSEKI